MYWIGCLALASYNLIEMACKMWGLGGILETLDTLTPSSIDDKTGSKKYNDFPNVIGTSLIWMLYKHKF